MTRIATCFEKLRNANRKALISYITAGDPHPDATVDIMHALVDAGSNVIELGVPFSDPMADGPVIQAACERALRYDTSLQDVLEMVKKFRQDDDSTPVILMGYQNPIEVFGVEAFAKAASGLVDGLITVDLPPEESDEFAIIYKKYIIDCIYLLSPTTNESRIKTIANLASGFLYYVSFKGITGANRLDASSVETKVEQIRRCTKLPIAVGFGIKDATSAKSVADCADAVVVGSAIVSIIAQYENDVAKANQAIKSLLRDIRLALDSGDTTQKIA